MIGQFQPRVSKIYCVIQGDITRIYEFLRSKRAAPSQPSSHLTSMADYNLPNQNYRTVCLTENPRNQNACHLEKYPHEWSRPFLLENSIKCIHIYSSWFQPSWTQVTNIQLTAFTKLQTWTTSLRFILHNRMNELFVCTRPVQCPSPGASIYINTQTKHIPGRWLGQHSKLLAIRLYGIKERDKCTDYE
jgi:hypothetical protein